MLEELKTAEELHREGKLEKKLRRRIRIFEILSFLFGLITLYDIVIEGFYWFHVFLVVSISFLFGLFVMARIHKVSWDKRRQVMNANKMDLWGFLILVLYVGARIASERYLPDFFQGNVSMAIGYTFFIACGVTLGRFVGILAAIHKAEPKRHQKLRFLRKNK